MRIFGCLLSLLIGCCEATVTQHGREAIYLRMFRNLARLMPETAGMRLCRFVSEEMKEHMPETTMD